MVKIHTKSLVCSKLDKEHLPEQEIRHKDGVFHPFDFKIKYKPKQTQDHLSDFQDKTMFNPGYNCQQVKKKKTDVSVSHQKRVFSCLSHNFDLQ